MLWYMPLEGYKERYTLQWSASKTGWLERNWIKAGIPYRRIEGEHEQRSIKIGSVVDGVGRSLHCFTQIEEILKLAEEGKIRDSDVIFLDDFWTPGLEALPYAFHLLGIKPRMYAFLHAQSVDEFDFTHPMRSWMRPIETGFAQALDGIFVCCPTLQDLVVFGGIAPREKVHITGHPFSSGEVMERMPMWYQNAMAHPGLDPMKERKNQVVWSSRWDSEKNPEFFLQVADYMLSNSQIGANLGTLSFVVCTSASKIRSNDPRLLSALFGMQHKYPDNFFVKEGLTKEEYYAVLCESKIQFNCANQDFVAITLLESSVAGCYPVYPYFRSFPETFLWNKGMRYMYPHLDQMSAVVKLNDVLMREDWWTQEEILKRSWIHKRFDTSWLRQLKIMGLAGFDTGISTKESVEASWDPFDPNYLVAHGYD